MSKVEHTIRLESKEHFAQNAPLRPIGTLLRRLPDAVSSSVLMAVEGCSKVRGRTPQWLKAASDIRLVGFSGPDETVLHFEAPTLGEAAESLYRQKELWNTKPNPDDTGFDLLGDIIRDVASENFESERFDPGLLTQLVRLGDTLNSAYQRFSLTGHRYAEHPAIFDNAIVESATRMTQRTPPSNRARIIGILDMIRASTDAFAIKLDDGQEVSGVIANGTPEKLPELWQKRVLVLGDAIYKPSGRLLRIDAESICLTEDVSSLWSRIPAPNAQSLDRATLRKSQGPKSGLAAIIGQWPGDEDEETVRLALEDIS